MNAGIARRTIDVFLVFFVVLCELCVPKKRSQRTRSMHKVHNVVIPF